MRSLPLADYLPTAKGLMQNMIARDAVYPFYASLKLTSNCHFACPFCNIWSNKIPDLSTAAIKTILDNIARSPVILTTFEGGEPLLRPDIGELLEYARTKAFYLLLVTSVKNLKKYPMIDFARNIDFLHISIDEGHDNLDLLDVLPEIVRLPTHVSIQTVVTRNTVAQLEEKVRRCHDCGANIVILPAVHMNATDDQTPDMDALEHQMADLRRRYPDTIHTPQGFFKAYREGHCSTDSVIIAPDGRLYYPCHILETKGPDLTETDLTTWLQTPEARQLRAMTHACDRNCGWYQYYATSSYASLGSVWESLKPVLAQSKRRHH